MDLKNFETTSTYAIEALYKDYWNQLPEKYRLLEKAQRQEDYTLEEVKPTQQKSTPLTYASVKAKDTEPEKPDEYQCYCDALNDKEKFFNLQPFYDPELSFSDRLHYKLTGINYPDRKGPWFIITWNCGNGILKSTLTNRRFQSATVETPSGELVTFDFMNTELEVTLCFVSNTMQGLFELQEHIRISRREKAVVNTRQHSILGSFPVSIDLIDGGMAKLARDKGTLCTLTLPIKIDYPIIDNVRSAARGIIKEIHAEIDNDGNGPGEQAILARDIIK